MFGIGDYSFSSWKVAISGLYKNIRFNVVPPQEHKATQVDDTCYFFPCKSKNEAEFWVENLNSSDCRAFIESLVFQGAKRPITIDVLKRIDFRNLAKRLGQQQKGDDFLKKQGLLLF